MSGPRYSQYWRQLSPKHWYFKESTFRESPIKKRCRGITTASPSPSSCPRIICSHTKLTLAACRRLDLRVARQTQLNDVSISGNVNGTCRRPATIVRQGVEKRQRLMRPKHVFVATVTLVVGYWWLQGQYACICVVATAHSVLSNERQGWYPANEKSRSNIYYGRPME